MTCNNKDRILQLYGDLTGDYVSSFPDIDWNDPMFQIPQELLDKILEDHNPVDINQVTTKEFDGSGDFDVLMYSTSAHLKEEYKNKRITGADYAKAWVSMFESTMAQAVGFTLAKDEAKWKAIQARLEAIQAITNLKLAQAQIAALRQEEGLKKAQYGLVKAQLVTEELNQCRIREETANVVTQRDQILEQTRQIKYITDTQLPAQVANTNSDTAIKDYQLDNILPKEAANLTKQGVILDKQAANIEAETALTSSNKSKVDYEVSDVLPAQVANTEAQTSLVTSQKTQTDYTTSSVLSAQVANTEAQTSLVTQQEANLVKDALHTEAQTSLVTSQKTQTDYTTSSILPAQVTNQEKQTALLDYDLTKLKPQELVIRTNEALLKKYEYEHIIPVELGIKQAQLDIQEEELNIKKYELLNKLPAEVGLLTAQSGLTNAQATHESVKKDLTTQQKSNLVAEALNIPKQGKVLDAQSGLTNAQATHESVKKDLTTQQKSNLVAEALNIPKQGKVLDAQEGLIKEQTESERANTLDTRKDGAAVKGSVGAQKDLYKTQAIAYRDDTRIKAGKLWADAWAVRYTISESEEVPGTFSDKTVDKTLEDIKLKFGT